MVYRQIKLRIITLQYAVSPKLYQYFHQKLGLEFELFASSFNCYSNNFCSISYDIERFFGSKGSFFDLEIKEGVYGFNPPYAEDVINASLKRVVELLNSSETLLTFVMALPVWDNEGKKQLQRMGGKVYQGKDYGECKGLKLLNEYCGDYAAYKRIFHKE